MMDGREFGWDELLSTVDPEVLAAAAAKTEAHLTSLRLRELRKARGLTQAEIADLLDIRQVSVSRLEARSDVHVSTLRSVIEAMGGEIEIRARFPDAEYQIELSDGEEARVERVKGVASRRSGGSVPAPG